MYKLLLTLSAVSSVIVGVVNTNVAVAMWPDSSSDIALTYQTSVANIPDVNCRYQYQQFEIEGVDDPKNVCINQSAEGLVVGAYLEKGRYYYVAGSVADEKLYSLRGCSGADSCLYVSSQDLLLVKQHRINSIVYALIGYNEVTEKLRLVYDTTAQKLVYEMDMSSPDYILENKATSYPWPIEAWALSANEKWLVLELRGRGFAVMDMESMNLKRISTRALRYGQGMDPRAQLAISNDGTTVSVMGNNVGARMIVGVDTCGEFSDDNQIDSNTPLSSPCKEPSLPLGSWIDDALYGYLPKFDSTGYQLSFFVSTRQGAAYQLAVLPYDYVVDTVTYLAMGDSFSSGEGETDDRFYLAYTNAPYAKCHTSLRSYPYLVAQQLLLNESSVKNVACSGARMDDISGQTINYWGQSQRLAEQGLDLAINERLTEQQQALVTFTPGLVHQEKFVELYHPPLITIGIGGNDAGLFGKLKTCLMPDTCEWASDQESIYQTGKEIDSLKDRLVTTYKRLIQHSPDSDLYVIGYPQLVSDQSDCGTLGKLLDASERTFFINSIAKLNDVIKSAALEAGVEYVDVSSVFDDHQLCQDSKAVNSIRLGDDIAPSSLLAWLKLFGNESFHPTPFGHELLGKRVTDAINGNIEDDQDGAIDEVYWQNDTTEQPPLQIQTSMTSSTDIKPDDQLVLSIASGTLRPMANFDVSLHSTPAHLITAQAAADGSARISINLPNSTSAGFHTLHIVGESFSGSKIDLYQVISYHLDSLQQGELHLDTSEPEIVAAEPESASSLHSINDQSSLAGTSDDPTDARMVVSLPKIDQSINESSLEVGRVLAAQSTATSDLTTGLSRLPLVTVYLLVGFGVLLLVLTSWLLFRR